MNLNSPYKFFQNVPKGSLEKLPCSILALGLALMSAKANVGELGVGVDENGYCQLTNMSDAIKKHFHVKQYHYYKKESRKKLNEYVEFPGKYIVCVKGHYIYIENDDYYSFFNNSEDEVVAYWALGDVRNETE